MPVAIPVVQTGLSPTFYSVCALIIVQVSIVFGVWLKGRPGVMKVAADIAAVVRKEKRDDVTDCEKRLDEMTEKVNKLTEQVHQLDIKLLASISAYRIVDTDLAARVPGSVALANARAILSVAYTLSPSTPAEFGSILAEGK